jgi:hypothetical protein
MATKDAPITPDKIKDRELRTIYSSIYADKSQLDDALATKRQQIKARQPQTLAAFDADVAKIDKSWESLGVHLVSIDANLHNLTPAQRDEQIKQATANAEQAKALLEEARTDVAKPVAAAAHRPTAHRGKGKHPHRRAAHPAPGHENETYSSAFVRRLAHMDIFGTLTGHGPSHSRDVKRVEDSINHTVVTTLDHATTAVGGFVGSTYTAAHDLITGENKPADKPGTDKPATDKPAAPATDAAPATPGADKPEKERTWTEWWNGVTESFSGDGKNTGAGGKIAGGVLGVGLAYLISSMFGSGPIKWVLMLLLAPLLGILGATKIGDAINGWFGGGKSSSTPAQGQGQVQGQGVNGQGINGPQQGQCAQQGQQYYSLDGKPFGSEPYDITPFQNRRHHGRERDHHREEERFIRPYSQDYSRGRGPVVYGQVHNVRGIMPRGVTYDANEAPQVTPQYRPPEPYGPIRDRDMIPHNPDALRPTFLPYDPTPAEQVYHGGREQMTIRADSNFSRMSVQGADMAAVSVNNVNIYAPNSRIKVVVRGN